MNEQCRADTRIDISEALQNFGPAIDAIRVRTCEPDAELRILRRHSGAIIDQDGCLAKGSWDNFLRARQ